MDTRVSPANKLAGSPNSVADWVWLVANSSLPVLPATAAELARLRADPEQFSAHDLDASLEADPLFAAKLFAYLAIARGARAEADVGTVRRAITMMGTGPFLAAFDRVPALADSFAGKRDALRGFVRVVRRARRAARFAGAIAAWRNDLAIEEITLAALLHDIAEMLLWCLRPEAPAHIARLQSRDAALRSAVAQRAVLGFELPELQLALAKRWRLPSQLVAMMHHDASAGPRGRCVALAVNLARHSSRGWNNPALPDDFRDLAELLQVTPAQARGIVGAPAA